MVKSNNDTPTTTSKLPDVAIRMPISQLNPYLTCALCNGYLIDATTIVECLHSFCRSCLLTYFDQNPTCPICETPINKTQWTKCIKSDQTLQDLVYKLVPGLYGNELKRRKEFFLEHCANPSSGGNDANSKSTPAKFMHIFDKHLVDLASCICSPDEIVSFSVEFQQSKKTAEDGAKMEDNKTLQGETLNFKRYFRCPAAVKIGHLKKLLSLKLDLPDRHKVAILYGDEILENDLTLMDIAYIYSWRRKTPLQLYFTVYKLEVEEEVMPELDRQIEIPSVSPESQENNNNNNNNITTNNNKNNNIVSNDNINGESETTKQNTNNNDSKLISVSSKSSSPPKGDKSTKINVKRSLDSVMQKLAHTVDLKTDFVNKISTSNNCNSSSLLVSTPAAPIPAKKPRQSRQSTDSTTKSNKIRKSSSTSLNNSSKQQQIQQPPPSTPTPIVC